MALLRWYAYGLGPNDVLGQMNVQANTRLALLPFKARDLSQPHMRIGYGGGSGHDMLAESSPNEAHNAQQRQGHRY